MAHSRAAGSSRPTLPKVRARLRQDFDEGEVDNHWNDDNDFAEALAVGMVAAGTAAVVSAATTPSTTVVFQTAPAPTFYQTAPAPTLTGPCPAQVVIASSGTTFYQCGATRYTASYAGGGVAFLAVAPPPGY